MYVLTGFATLDRPLTYGKIDFFGFDSYETQFPCFWIYSMGLRRYQIAYWVTANDADHSSCIWNKSSRSNASNSESSKMFSFPLRWNRVKAQPRFPFIFFLRSSILLHTVLSCYNFERGYQFTLFTLAFPTGSTFEWNPAVLILLIDSKLGLVKPMSIWFRMACMKREFPWQEIPTTVIPRSLRLFIVYFHLSDNQHSFLQA